MVHLLVIEHSWPENLRGDGQFRLLEISYGTIGLRNHNGSDCATNLWVSPMSHSPNNACGGYVIDTWCIYGHKWFYSHNGQYFNEVPF